jgi:hypothetical protein
VTDPYDILRDPLVVMTDHLVAQFTPAQASALLALLELYAERIDGRSASLLAMALRRVARVERRQDIADRVTFSDPLSPY